MAVISVVDMADEHGIGGIVDRQISTSRRILIGVKNQRKLRRFQFERSMAVPGDFQHFSQIQLEWFETKKMRWEA